MDQPLGGQWVIESLLSIPGLEAEWEPVFSWPDSRDDEMTEEEADAWLETYRRTMPGREYRKRFVEDIRDEDIPF